MADDFVIYLKLKPEAEAARAARSLGGGGGGGSPRVDRRTERGLERFLFRQPLRALVRYGVGETVTNLFSDMIHSNEHGAYSELGRVAADLGVNVGVRSLFMGSLKGGAIIGTVVTILHEAKRTFDQIEQRNKKVAEDIQRAEDQFRKIQAENEAIFADSLRLSEERLKDIEEKLFAREIA